MKLDKRIIEGKKPLTCFDTEQAKEFLGKECYFSNCKTTLKDGTEKICLGGAFYYTMQELFDLFELRSRGEWLPFGIEE